MLRAQHDQVYNYLSQTICTVHSLLYKLRAKALTQQFCSTTHDVNVTTQYMCG